jgi:site-specific DNA-cytosine methylase
MVGLFNEIHTDIEQPKDRGVLLRDILQDESEVDEKYYLSEKAIDRMLRKNYSKPKINPEKTGCLSISNNSSKGSFDSGTTLISIDINGKAPTQRSSTGRCLDRKHNYQIIEKDKKLRRLTPIECERLQTAPDNFTSSVSDTQRYKMLGNGMTVEKIKHILSYL